MIDMVNKFCYNGDIKQKVIKAMTALAVNEFETPPLSPYMPTQNKGGLTTSDIHPLVESRDKEVARVKAFIALVGDDKRAIDDIFKALFEKQFPNHRNIEISPSVHEMGQQSGFQLAQSAFVNENWDIDVISRMIDAKYWSRVVTLSDVDVLMSAKQQREWQGVIDRAEAPEFNIENIIESVSQWRELQAQAFIDRIESVWEALSGTHVTNAKTHFSTTMIVGSGSDAKEVLTELRSIVNIVEGRAPIPRSVMNSNMLLKRIEWEGLYGEWQWIEGNAMALKYHKSETMHLKVNPVTAAKMNDILAMRYPTALPSSSRDIKRARRKNAPVTRKTDDVLSFNVVTGLDEIRSKPVPRFEREEQYSFDVAPPFVYISLGWESDKREEKARNDVMTWLGASEIRDDNGFLLGWRSEYNLKPALSEVIIRSSLPNVQSYQFYPSKGQVGERAAQWLISSLDDDGTFEYIEPHAGHGHLARHLPKERTTAVELSTINAAVLRGAGFDVHCRDFLKYAETCTQRFDGVLMNPPFTDGQAIEHTVTAAMLLKPKGVLVAILPMGSGELLKAKLEGNYDCERSAPIENAFEGVNVTVELVKISPNLD
jgi:hypothetical protein